MPDTNEPVPLRDALRNFCIARWRKAEKDLKAGAAPKRGTPWDYIGKIDRDLMRAAIACKAWGPWKAEPPVTKTGEPT